MSAKVDSQILFFSLFISLFSFFIGLPCSRSSQVYYKTLHMLFDTAKNLLL